MIEQPDQPEQEVMTLAELPLYAGIPENEARKWLREYELYLSKSAVESGVFDSWDISVLDMVIDARKYKTSHRVIKSVLTQVGLKNQRGNAKQRMIEAVHAVVEENERERSLRRELPRR